MLSQSSSAHFPQRGLGHRQEFPSSFSVSSIPVSTSTSSSSSASISTSTDTSTSTFASTSAHEFGVETGIIPSATMLSAPVPGRAPVQYPSVPFVSARARVAEFERLREELRKTEMVRKRQVEMLQALVPEPIPAVGMSVNPSFHLQVDHSNHYPEAYPMPAPIHVSMPTSMTAPIPIPIQYHHHCQQRQQLPYAPVVGVGSTGFIARGRVAQACENCKLRKVKCNGGSPCERCAERALRCIYGEKKVRGPTKKRREKRDIVIQQVLSSSPTPPPPLDTTEAFVAPLTSFTAPLPEPLPVRVSLPTPPPDQLRPQPPARLPPPSLPSSRSTLLSAVPSLSRPLFSPPTPAAPTLICALGQVVRPTVTSPHNDIPQPSSPEFLRSGHTNLIQPPSSSEPAITSNGSASPERFSDEEIQITLEMSSEPFGAPGGFFVFPDPPQGVTSGDTCLLPDQSPKFDFILDFEAGLDSSFEVVGNAVSENVHENQPEPLVEVKPSPPPASTQAPRMPTIPEEDEQDEEDGDVTITPNAAQRALLPPDRFARPPSVARPADAADALQDAELDSLDTPRPNAQATSFSEPTPDTFDASFSLEAGPNDSQDPQDYLGQFGFLSSLMTSEPANVDFDGSLDVDISAWNEAVFGESPSQESTPSSSWELMSKEGPSMEMGTDVGIDMQLQFPSIDMGAIGEGIGMMPTEDEFMRAIMEVAQSTPKAPLVRDASELFWEAGDFDL